MSIFFEFDVGTRGRLFRRAVDGDKSDIESIINRQHTDCLFGTPDIGHLIELSTLAICMINEDKEVTGFMALCDHPNIVGVDPADWEIWIRNMFQKYYLSRNTLFVHFMCCIDAATDTFLEEAFVSVFRNDMYLLNIVIVVPRDCPADWTTRYGTFKRHNIYKFHPKIDGGSERSLYIHTAMRKNFCPKLKIRRAVEEDNDDIVEILGKTCPALQELYGNYYISEIIGRHPEMDRKIIVADYQDQAVGVMCLSSAINYEMLQKTYELGPYHGLRKATPLEKENCKRSNDLLNTFGMPIMLGKWSPFKVLSKQDFTKRNNEPKKVKLAHKRTKGISRVNFDRRADAKDSYDHIFYAQTSEDYSEKEFTSPSSSMMTRRSVARLLGEDPFDYEIVNIDNKLLSVPEVLSCEFLLSRVRNEGSQRSHAMQKVQDRRNQRSITFQRPSYEEEELVMYSGDPNAFVIELFGFREDIDDRQSFHLLEIAFELMKTYDYCIIRVPCKEKSFHLLEHFCFVPTRNKINSEYSLYVAHRNSVLSKLRVRKAELIDIPQITQLLSNLDGRETLWTVENTILNKNQLQCYVFLSGVALIGVGILEKPEQIDFIRAKYNLDSYRINKYYNSEDYHNNILTAKSVLVYPVFETHFRFFARDMMRLSGANALLWLTAYRNKWVIHKTNSLAGAMIPLIPRKSEIDCTLVPELKKIRELLNTVMPFSTWFINKKISSVSRVNVNTRLLVVGASRTAMAFLNALLFSDSSPYLFFTNVTLLSPVGLPYSRRTKAISEMMFPKYRTNSEGYLKSVPYTYYVNVVQGTMVEINKRDKYITLSNGSKYNYDLLFLLLGKQYQHPEYLKPIIEREKEMRSGINIPKYIRLDTPHQPAPEPKIDNDGNYTPSNVFIVNTISDANKALNAVKSFTYMGTDYNIIVYGATLHAYCCLATLIEMKIPPANIAFVEPFPSEDPKEPRVSLFCNVNVDKSVSKMLNNLKIKVYRSYYFQRWYTDSDNLVTYIDFLSHYQFLRLKCSAFFYYGTTGVNEQAFIAINKSGMAYDGGILIDHEFKTKDPSIYAAGPATRYRRKYYADNTILKYYDAYEVGTKLGFQIKDQLDPLFKEVRKELGKSMKDTKENVNLDSSETMNTKSIDTEASSVSQVSDSLEDVPKVPVFIKPHVFYCTLPGGLQYLEVRSPGKKIPHQYVQSLEYNGIVMETFKGGYFKLHLTNDLIVDGITCLTPEKYPLENFKNLYGLSAAVLNNVHLRYTTKKLDDFYAFFLAPWAFFLYHDQVDELFAMVKELLPKGTSHGETLYEAMRTLSENSNSPSSKLKIRSTFEKSPHLEAITDYVIQWLSENDVLLPMYLQPSQTCNYTHDLDRNPAFKKRKNTIVKMMAKIF